MWNYYGGMFDWGVSGWLMMAGMVLFWVLGIAFVVWLVGEASRGRHSRSRALDLLNERYARGEIDKKEYEAKKKDIEE